MSQVQQHQHVTAWTGWIGFASIVMGVTGFIHMIYGIGAIFTQSWYVYTSSETLVFDPSAWGWAMVGVGLLLMLSAVLLASGNMAGRIIGVTLALASLVVNVAVFAAAPVWSSIAIVVDMLIIYAIVAHGSEMKHLDEATEVKGL